MERRQLVILVVILLIVLSVSVVGFRLTREPEDLVSMTLDKVAVNPGERFTLRIEN